MKKIVNFQIQSLSIEGFKCFAEPATFEFGPTSLISGHNGVGKSSLADAISFAITGVPFFGGPGLDRLYSDEKKCLSLSLVLIDGEGDAHRLIRQRLKDVMTVTYDGMALRQSDLDAMFGERDIFLSIFNPLYFIECLGDKGRSLLERYLPVIPDSKVMDELDAVSRAVLEDVDMPSPSEYLKRLRSDIRASQENITYLEGQRDALSSQDAERRAAFTIAQKKLDDTVMRIGELEAQQYVGLDQSVINDHLADLYARHEELGRETHTAPDTAELDAAIRKAIGAQEQARCRVYEPKYSQAAAEEMAMLQRVKGEYIKARAVLAGLKPGVQCPTCRQMITEQTITAVTAEWQSTLDGLTAQGKTQNGKLAELQTLEDKSAAVFEEYQAADVAKAERELAELERQRAALCAAIDDGTVQTELDTLSRQIRDLEIVKERGVLSTEEWVDLTGLRAVLPTVEADAERFRECIGDSPVEKEQMIEVERESIRKNEQVANAAALFIAKKTGLQFSDFKLNRVAISLYEIVKTTGELKDVFKFTYEGRPYQILSLSEKIRAGLEVSELIKRLMGCNYPVFVDNGESVPVIDNIRPQGQVFVSSVVKHAPLCVKIPGKDTPGEKPAEQARAA